MNDNDTRCFEMFQRVNNFGEEETASFASNTFITGLYNNLKQVTTELETHANTQASGMATARQTTQSKAAARERLQHDLRVISRTARSMSETIPGLEEKFRLTTERKDQDLLIRARMFAADALPLKAEFIKRGLSQNFLEELEEDIAALEEALAERTHHTKAHVSATAAIDDLIERGMRIVRELDAVMRNVFEDNAAKLAAWMSASRVERAPHRRRPVPGTSPTP